MQQLNGYVKLHRKLVQWGWYQDNVVKSLFLHFLLTAAYRDFEWNGIQIKAGQLITGRKKLAAELGFSEQQIRTAIGKLKATEEITTKSTNKYTLITVVNWAEYQICDDSVNRQKNRQTTNRQPHIKNKKIKEYTPYIFPPQGGKRKKERHSYDIELFEKTLNGE